MRRIYLYESHDEVIWVTNTCGTLATLIDILSVVVSIAHSGKSVNIPPSVPICSALATLNFTWLNSDICKTLNCITLNRTRKLIALAYNDITIVIDNSNGLCQKYFSSERVQLILVIMMIIMATLMILFLNFNNNEW